MNAYFATNLWSGGRCNSHMLCIHSRGIPYRLRDNHRRTFHCSLCNEFCEASVGGPFFSPLPLAVAAFHTAFCWFRILFCAKTNVSSGRCHCCRFFWVNASGDTIRERLPVRCDFTTGAPLFRVVHANFVVAKTHDWFRVSEMVELKLNFKLSLFIRVGRGIPLTNQMVSATFLLLINDISTENHFDVLPRITIQNISEALRVVAGAAAFANFAADVDRDETQHRVSIKQSKVVLNNRVSLDPKKKDIRARERKGLISHTHPISNPTQHSLCCCIFFLSLWQVSLFPSPNRLPSNSVYLAASNRNTSKPLVIHICKPIHLFNPLFRSRSSEHPMYPRL